MTKPTTFLRNLAAPSAETLYERAMQDQKTYNELPDGTKLVPIFNPEFTRFDQHNDVQLLSNKDGEAYASKRRYSIETSFGIDYTAVLYQPTDDPRHNFYIDIDTAVCTGVNGLNDEVAARLVEEIGVPVILKGPEFSGESGAGLGRLASVALAATNISQSFSAETSMAISAEIVDFENLPRRTVVYGKSRGAMVGGKKYPYAHDREIDVIHYRLIDPCVGRRALEGPADVLRYGIWPASDLMQSLPSFAKFALEGKLKARARTIETSPSYLTGMLLGAVPSLLSGETTGDCIPLHKGVSLVHMANNPIADTADYLQQFSHHPNFDHHEVSDTHMGGIVLPRNIRRTVRHLKDFGSAFDQAGGDEAQIDWTSVHNNPQKASITRIHAA